MLAIEESSSRLVDKLDRLADALERLSLGPRFPSLAAERDRLARAVREYLIPRAADGATPVTVVFAGPTGSGKSTLINSLTGSDISAAGPLRPTTTVPLVLASSGDAGEIVTLAGIAYEVVRGNAPILDSLVLVDTPDIDSTSTEHRAVAESLIDRADVVVFVTSALRYSDAIPWQVLRRAESRGSDVVHILNRVDSANRAAVTDFPSRLASAGLNDEIITIAEHHLPPRDQRIPQLAIRPVRRKLVSLARERDGTAEHAFEQVLGTTVRQTQDLQRSLQSLAGDLAASRSGLSFELQTRAARLDLTSAADDLLPPLPDTESPRKVRRWRRIARRLDLAKQTGRVVSRIEGVVHEDLRRWLFGDAEEGWHVRIEPGQIVAVASPATRTAMEGWVEFVRNVAGDGAPRDSDIAEAVLLKEATDTSHDRLAQAVLGVESAGMVERARAELTCRLEVVYEQVASHVYELLETQVGIPDLGGVRTALAAMGPLPVPADA